VFYFHALKQILCKITNWNRNRNWKTITEITLQHGSWQPVGASKICFTFHFWDKSFIFDDVKLADLSNNSFEWKNVTFLGGQNILWPLLHILRGQDPQTPRIYVPASVSQHDDSKSCGRIWTNFFGGRLDKPKLILSTPTTGRVPRGLLLYSLCS